jgi:hypothetical protein
MLDLSIIIVNYNTRDLLRIVNPFVVRDLKVVVVTAPRPMRMPDVNKRFHDHLNSISEWIYRKANNQVCAKLAR